MFEGFKFLAPTEKEFVEAVQYYNSECAGLGFEFAVEVARTFSHIAQYPEAWHQLSE